MKRVSDGREAAMPIPVILKPIEVQFALGTVPVKIGDVAIAVQVPPHGANVRNIVYYTIP